MASCKVDIFVGSEMKQYSVPVDIPRYYSPYFDRYFHRSFKEAAEQKLTLPEDRVEGFDVILDYMLTGHIPTTFEVKESDKAGLEKCISFTEYADKYSIAEAGMVVYDILIEILQSCDVILRSNHIKTVFRTFPEKHAMRKLIAKAALNTGFSGKATYNKSELEVDGFAREMLRHLRHHVELQMINRSRNLIPLDRPEVSRFELFRRYRQTRYSQPVLGNIAS